MKPCFAWWRRPDGQIIGFDSHAPMGKDGNPVVLVEFRTSQEADQWVWASQGVKSEPVKLANGVVDQLLVDGIAPLAHRAEILREIRRRENARGAAPLPAGGLFDETARNQQELF